MKTNKSILWVCSLVLLLSVNCQSVAQMKDTDIRPIPDKLTHSAFLLSTWKNDAPTLIAFKDPQCGYCIKALKQRARLANYNVFLFWSPILGKASNTKVDAIFTCDSPVSEELLHNISMREGVSCDGQQNKNLREVNDQMVSAYRPTFVPQYWVGGKTHSFAQLELTQSTQDVIAQVKFLSDLHIPWERYNSLALNANLSNTRTNVALVLPEKQTLPDSISKHLENDNRFNWFIFAADNNPKDIEFRLLNDIQKTTLPIIILEGKQLTAQESSLIFSKQLNEFIGKVAT